MSTRSVLAPSPIGESDGTESGGRPSSGGKEMSQSRLERGVSELQGGRFAAPNGGHSTIRLLHVGRGATPGFRSPISASGAGVALIAGSRLSRRPSAAG